MEKNTDDQESDEIKQNDYKLENKLIFGKFLIKKKLDQGTFSKIYLGINISTEKSEKVAIKFEPKINYPSLLHTEAKILFLLKGFGIPSIKSFGIYENYNVLIESLLGKSLNKILSEEGGNLPIKDCCMIALQIINRLEFVHSKYFIHRDIKPENFVIGNPDIYNIYLINFGLAKKYKSSRTKKHINFSVPKKFTGSVRYASCNALRGLEQSRRDDLESAGYTILYLFKGNLPWSNLKAKEKCKKYRQIYKIKKFLEPEKMCENLPEEMSEYLKYVKSLKFQEKPNYDRLRFYFYSILKKIGTKNDLRFSWIKDEKILKIIEQKNINIFRNNDMDKKLKIPQTKIYKSFVQNSIENLKKNKILQNINVNSEEKEYDKNRNIKYYQTNLNTDVKIIMNKRKYNLTYNNDNTLTDSHLTKNYSQKYTSIKKNILKDENSKENDLKTLKTNINMTIEENLVDAIDERDSIEKNFIKQKKYMTEYSGQVKKKIIMNFNTINQCIGNNNLNYRYHLKPAYYDIKKNNKKNILNNSEPKYIKTNESTSSNNSFNNFINNNHNKLYKDNNSTGNFRMNKKHYKTYESVDFNDNIINELNNSHSNNPNDFKKINIINCKNIQKKLANGIESTEIKKCFNSNFSIPNVPKENTNINTLIKSYNNNNPKLKIKVDSNDISAVNSCNFHNIKIEKYFNNQNFSNNINQKINNNQSINKSNHSNTQRNYFITNIYNKKKDNIDDHQRNKKILTNKLVKFDFIEPKNMNQSLINNKNISYNKLFDRKINFNRFITNKGNQNNTNYSDNKIKKVQNKQVTTNNINNINNTNIQEQKNIILTREVKPEFQYKKINCNSNGNNYIIIKKPKVKAYPAKINNNINNKKRILQMEIENPNNGENNITNNNIKRNCLIYRGIKRENGLATKNINMTSYSKEKQIQKYRINTNIFRPKILTNNISNTEGNIFNINNNKPMKKNNARNINNRNKIVNMRELTKIDYLSDF